MSADGNGTSSAGSSHHSYLDHICHDLRNPLSSAIMGAENLLRTTLSDPQRKVAELVLRSCQKALDMVEDLLASQNEADPPAEAG